MPGRFDIDCDAVPRSCRQAADFVATRPGLSQPQGCSSQRCLCAIRVAVPSPKNGVGTRGQSFRRRVVTVLQCDFGPQNATRSELTEREPSEPPTFDLVQQDDRVLKASTTNSCFGLGQKGTRNPSGSLLCDPTKIRYDSLHLPDAATMACTQKREPLQFELNLRTLRRIARGPGEKRPQPLIGFSLLSIHLLRLCLKDRKQRRKRAFSEFCAGGLGVSACVNAASKHESVGLFCGLRTAQPSDSCRHSRFDTGKQRGAHLQCIGRSPPSFIDRCDGIGP